MQGDEGSKADHAHLLHRSKLLEPEAFMAGRKLSDPDSLAKAAAWMWYMRGKGNVREGGWLYVQPAARSRERKASRFKAEAMAMAMASSDGIRPSAPASSTSSLLLWDCESELYDSFELLSFSDRLNRTLSATPSIASSSLLVAPKDDGPTSPSPTPLDHDGHEHYDVDDDDNDDDDDQHHHNEHGKGLAQTHLPHPKFWSVRGFVRALKKVATNNIHKRMRSPKAYVDPCHHHHHHHHHHYHHLLHHRYNLEDQHGFFALIGNLQPSKSAKPSHI